MPREEDVKQEEERGKYPNDMTWPGPEAFNGFPSIINGQIGVMVEPSKLNPRVGLYVQRTNPRHFPNVVESQVTSTTFTKPYILVPCSKVRGSEKETIHPSIPPQ